MLVLLVYLLIAVACLACVAMVVVIFHRVATSRKDRPVFLKFIVIEFVLVVGIMAILRLLTGPVRGYLGLVVGSVLLALMANLPIALIPKVVQTRRRESQQ